MNKRRLLTKPACIFSKTYIAIIQKQVPPKYVNISPIFKAEL